MTDEHDRCEWVNVPSGTGSPGWSWTKSIEHKTVMCVCVVQFSVAFRLILYKRCMWYL